MCGGRRPQSDLRGKREGGMEERTCGTGLACVSSAPSFLLLFAASGAQEKSRMGQCPDRPTERPTVVGGRADLTTELPPQCASGWLQEKAAGGWMDGWRVGRPGGWGHFFEIRSLEHLRKHKKIRRPDPVQRTGPLVSLALQSASPERQLWWRRLHLTDRRWRGGT